MSIFDMFRPKSKSDVMQDEMRRLAPILFPGGHEEILAAGRSISAMLDSRIPADSAARLFASTKYLAHTAKGQSKQQIVQYIVRGGMGKISEEDAAAIYDRYIIPASSPAPAGATVESEPGRMFINADLADREYRLQNSVRFVRIDAVVFTALLLGLRSNGWQGAANLFDSTGVMMKALSGSYAISERDARELATLLEQLINSRDLNGDMGAAMRPLITIAAQGAFTIYA